MTNIAKEEAPSVPDKAALRNAIFAEEFTKPQAYPIKFNGVDLEWRTPSLLQVQRVQDDDSKNLMVMMLIRYTYVPGTNERVFEDKDYDKLQDMPMNGSFSAAISVIAKALNMGVDEKVKN